MRSSSRSYRIMILLVTNFMVTCFIFTNVYAQKRAKKYRPALEVHLQSGVSYDDNILRYSDHYLNLFSTGSEADRFLINSTAGTVVSNDIDIGWKNYFFKRLPTEISALVSHRVYAGNTVKSWNSWQLDAKQYLHKRTAIGITYANIPDFYIRHQRKIDDTGNSQSVPFEFSKVGFSIRLIHSFSRHTKIWASFADSRYDYSQIYTNYNSRNRSYRFDLYQSITRKLRVNGGVEFTNSVAEGGGGKDTVYVEENNSARSTVDPSYNDVTVRLGLRFDLPKFADLRHQIRLYSRYGRRTFTTSESAQTDRLHAGRQDRILSLGVNYRFYLNRQFNIQVFYNWYQRDADSRFSENRDYISREKNYTQQKAGLKVGYKFSL